MKLFFICYLLLPVLLCVVIVTSQGQIILTGRAPTIVIQQPPPLSQFEAPSDPYQPESNATSMGHVVLTISPALNEEGTLSSSTLLYAMDSKLPSISHRKFHHYKKTWKLVFDAALFSIFPSLTRVSQLKFTSQSPFETHRFFSNMGVVAYVIAVGTSVLFFHRNGKKAYVRSDVPLLDTFIICVYVVYGVFVAVNEIVEKHVHRLKFTLGIPLKMNIFSQKEDSVQMSLHDIETEDDESCNSNALPECMIEVDQPWFSFWKLCSLLEFPLTVPRYME
ncbi:hypothetical protein Tco_1102213 [Tanacetum coccineum]